MAPIRAFPRILIAILSMVATMVGALEHESLLFQEMGYSGTDLVMVNGDFSATTQSSGEAFSRDGSETGTEGTYRSETQVLWTAPTDDFLRTWRVPEQGPARTEIEIPPHLGSQARFRVAGGLALRI